MTALLPCNHEVHLKDCEVCGRSFSIINMPTESTLHAENAKLREALEKIATAKVIYSNLRGERALDAPDRIYDIYDVKKLAQEALKNE